MKIGIISDTHDNVVSIQKAFAVFQRYSIKVFIHCGDWKSDATVNACMDLVSKSRGKLYGVLGNQDIFSPVSYRDLHNCNLEADICEIEISNQIIAICHGHKKRILTDLIFSQKYEVIFTGHTHKPAEKKIGNTLIINPGSTSFAIPRKRDFKGTIAIYDIETKQASVVELE